MAVALDVLFERTKCVRLDDVDVARPRGVALRGPEVLPVTIDW